MKALAKHSQMSTHLPGFQSFSVFLHHFVGVKLATSSIRVNISCKSMEGDGYCFENVLNDTFHDAYF